MSSSRALDATNSALRTVLALHARRHITNLPWIRALNIARLYQSRFAEYVRSQPFRTALITLGGTTVALSLASIPILGLFGFSSIGPVAGSLAAGWQSSIGLVQAGSSFALFQSASMGGAAAVATLMAGGCAVGGAIAVAGAGKLPAATKNIDRIKTFFTRRR